jgi:polysaccharide biosynthesis/export protein
MSRWFSETRLLTGLCLLFCCSVPPATAANNKTPRDLVQYIEDARRLGLKENEIRQNAVSAGWNKEMVAEAFAIFRYLNDTATPRNGATASGGGPAIQSASEPSGYRIGPGDVLQVLVWKEPEASVPNTVVRADGRITVPLIREVDVAGMTPGDLEKQLVEKLSKFIRGADVTVIVREIHSQKVYLMGAVRKEGPLQLQSNLTVLQAINAAGGLTDYAKKKKIYVLRSDNGRKIRLPFDYQAAVRGERPEQNITLQPDDMVVVP